MKISFHFVNIGFFRCIITSNLDHNISPPSPAEFLASTLITCYYHWSNLFDEYVHLGCLVLSSSDLPSLEFYTIQLHRRIKCFLRIYAMALLSLPRTSDAIDDAFAFCNTRIIVLSLLNIHFGYLGCYTCVFIYRP
jgi:hypothetical protein